MDRTTLTALVPSALLVTAGAVGTAMAVPGQGQGSPDGQPEDPDEPREEAEIEEDAVDVTADENTTAEENDDEAEQGGGDGAYFPAGSAPTRTLILYWSEFGFVRRQ